jgi:hypothetical protein
LVKYICPDSTVFERDYTDRGELWKVKQDSTVIDTRTYDDGGRMLTSTYDNGVTDTRTYNTDNTLAEIDFGGTGSAIGDLTYGWDSNKNETSETIAGVMSGYSFTVPTSGYDDEDRLVDFDGAADQVDQSWNLSLVGDWDSVTTDSTTQNRTHGPTHELLTAGGSSVTHDVKGNMTSIPANLRDSSDPLARWQHRLADGQHERAVRLAWIRRRQENHRAKAKYPNHALDDWLRRQRQIRWELNIVRRPVGAKGFVLSTKRWVLERTLSWLGRWGRLSRDTEHRTEPSEARVKIASIGRMLRHLSPDCTQPQFKY